MESIAEINELSSISERQCNWFDWFEWNILYCKEQKNKQTKKHGRLRPISRNVLYTKSSTEKHPTDRLDPSFLTFDIMYAWSLWGGDAVSEYSY